MAHRSQKKGSSKGGCDRTEESHDVSSDQEYFRKAERRVSTAATRLTILVALHCNWGYLTDPLMYVSKRRLHTSNEKSISKGVSKSEEKERKKVGVYGKSFSLPEKSAKPKTSRN